jgi:4-hydroxy-3-methylbut-2-enyl diphosphate reductase IspH
MTASASTPNKIIEEVQSHVRTNFWTNVRRII